MPQELVWITKRGYTFLTMNRPEKNSLELEGSAPEVLETVDTLEQDARAAEASLREQLVRDAAKKLADQTPPGDA